MISDSSIKRSDEKTKPDSLIAQRPIGNKTWCKGIKDFTNKQKKYDFFRF